jgi:predicted aspartyl protease
LLAAGGLLAGCAPRLAAAPIQVAASEPSHDPDTARLQTGGDANGRVTVPVEIEGQGPFDFVLDTGANSSVVSVELAARLGLRDGGPAQVHGIAGVEPAPTVLVHRLEADSIAMRDLRLPALLGERLGADGLLGVDVLRNRRVLMDFVRRRVTIGVARNAAAEPSAFELRQSSTGSSQELGRRIVVPARYRFGQLIIIAADVAGRGVTAFVDSGSQSTVGNTALRRMVFEGAPADPRATRYQVPVLSATGQTAQGELGRMPLLRVGGLDITGLTTVFSDLHVFDIWGLAKRPSLLLGMDILRRFNAIELNYARREVAFFLPASGRLR